MTVGFLVPEVEPREGTPCLWTDSLVEGQDLLFGWFLKLHEWLSRHFHPTPQPHHAMTWHMAQKNQGSVARLHHLQVPGPPEPQYPHL